MNPLLDPLTLPDFAALTPEAIHDALDEAIRGHRSVVADLTSRRSTDFADTWLPYERANTSLGALWSGVSHLHGVANTPELRTAFAAGQARLIENAIAVGQNRTLYEVMAAVAAAPGFAERNDEDRVAVERAIRDFTLSGVALDTEQRERFRAISVELSALSTEFGSAVLDATDAWMEHITDPARLAGMRRAITGSRGGAGRDDRAVGGSGTGPVPRVVPDPPSSTFR